MDNREVMVTIRCLAYNHEPYIRQCLEGFVMQKTNFRFEAIVHDDASTDGTAAIIREYAEKYPDIIKPIFETENQYSKRDGSVTRIMNAQKHGKYVAMCEGDDYWIDPLKLQKQVDFLEENLEYSLCFHRVKTTYEKGCNGKDVFAHVRPGEYTLDYILRRWTVPTGSMLFRKEILAHTPKNPDFKYGDNVLLLTCFSQGKVYCIDGVLGVYRRHFGGWTMNKPRVALSKEQYVHINALIDSFSNLSLDYLNEKKISYAAYIQVYDEELSTEWKQKIRHDFKLFPMKYIIQYLKCRIRKILGRK
ncbi:MAG: glycosyltransferase [Bacteroides sp.]|nr:glycosyltransferase [Bacteroides sp.]